MGVDLRQLVRSAEERAIILSCFMILGGMLGDTKFSIKPNGLSSYPLSSRVSNNFYRASRRVRFCCPDLNMIEAARLLHAARS